MTKTYQVKKIVTTELTVLLNEVKAVPLGLDFIQILYNINLTDEVKILALRSYKYYKFSKLGYHNFRHIVNVLKSISILTDGFKTIGIQYPELILAACYHDAVYIPGNNWNEWLSTMAFTKEYLNFRMLMRGCYSANDFLINELILGTRISDHLDSPLYQTPEIKILMDADLASLALDYHYFKEIQFSIASESLFSEQSVTSEQLIKSGEFLQLFADKPRIFRTELGIRHYEVAARKNIATFQAEVFSNK